jgi:thioesterase domain-containing protein
VYFFLNYRSSKTKTFIILPEENKGFVKNFLSLDTTAADWGRVLKGLSSIPICGDHWSIVDQSHIFKSL